MDTQLLPYRLKSARRKRRAVKTGRDKQLLALDRERERIRKDPGYKIIVLLDEPYQKGWKRLFVLKPEVQRSDKAAFYQGLLDKINTVQYHYDASFINSKRIRRWHRYYHKGLPTLKPLHYIEYFGSKLKLTDEERLYFIKMEYWNESRQAWAWQYKFSEPWRFKIEVIPNIIYDVKQVDTIMQQRLAWIDNHIENNNLESRIKKLNDGGWYKYWRSYYYVEKKKYVSPFKNKAKWDWDDE